MYMEISDLLLSQTDNYPQLQPRMEKLVAEIKYLAESCQPLAAYEVLEERAKDTELLRFVTSTIEANGELPTLKQRDYPAYVMLIALSQDSHVVAFLLDYLTFAYIRNYQVEELLLLSDVLYLLNSRNVLLNGLYNFVCIFFRNERRDVTKRRERRISDQEFARAERNMPHMGARSFMENVRIKACGVFTVKEFAQECGMASGCFYRKFKKEFGVTPGVGWMRNG